MTPKEGYRKIDNELFDAIIAAKLPGSVYQVVLTVIDRTLGFQKEKAAISLSKFQRCTRLSRQGVVNAIRYARGKNILTNEKVNGKVTIYALNRDCTTWATDVQLVKATLLDQSSRIDRTSQVATLRTESIKKTLNKLLKKDNALAGIYFSLEDIISYYLKTYQEYKGTAHPELKDEQWYRVVVALATFCDEYYIDCESGLKDFQVMIDYHFQRKLKTDYNINHFATKGILKNLYYKKLY